ncbi:MAG: glycosyltransferase family 4 protein [Terriglobia bacterium]
MNCDLIQNEPAPTSGASLASTLSTPGRYRLAAIFQRPHIYFCQFMQNVAAHPEIDLTVYFYTRLGMGSTPDPHFGRPLYAASTLLTGYRARFLRNYSPWPGVGPFFAWFHLGVVRELFRDYDAIILHGWWGASNLLAYLTAFVRGLPVLVHSDRNAILPQASRFRAAVLRWLFRHASAFLVIGKRNADFYRQSGVPDSKMFLSPLAVDNDFYAREAARLAPERSALRRQLGIAQQACALLYVGRFSPEKGIPDLLAAFKEVATSGAHLVLVGDGPEGERLKGWVAANHLEHVHFVGSKRYEELPACYALADVLVLPSRNDAWATVVNEAMNFALPVIASRQVGAADDLVEDGVNGFRFEAGDTAALASLLRRLVENPALRRGMGRASLPIIREWNFERATQGVLAALHSLRSKGG